MEYRYNKIYRMLHLDAVEFLGLLQAGCFELNLCSSIVFEYIIKMKSPTKKFKGTRDSILKKNHGKTSKVLFLKGQQTYAY